MPGSYDPERPEKPPYDPWMDGEVLVPRLTMSKLRMRVDRRARFQEQGADFYAEREQELIEEAITELLRNIRPR